MSSTSRLVDRLRFGAAVAMTGVAAGLAAALLTLLLHLVQHASFGYVEETFLLGVEQASGPRRILVLTGAGVVAGLGWWALRARFGPARSVGEAISGDGRMPLVRTLLDAGLQIVVVGLGASLGREAAPRETAAAFGSTIALRLGLSDRERILLVACGSGAGLGAVYNVPLGGAVFSVEILLASVAVDGVLVALATSLLATVTAWSVLPDRATYVAVPHHLTATLVLGAALLGPVAGVVAAGFVRLTATAKRYAPTGRRLVPWLVVVFSLLGLASVRYPELLGNGKGPAQLAFDGHTGLLLLATLVVLKPLATAACLRAGAKGGLFTPLLSTGAVLGALYPAPGAAVVGAGAVLAAGMRAPVTAVVVTLELVGSAGLVVPVVLAVVGAVATARAISDRSIYTPALR